MDALEKLEILAEAARFDAACTSSGSERGPRAGSLGATKAAGCCHTFTPDGRCVTLLKVLMSNACSYDCAYCVNRSSASCRRATFAPRELAELTVDFYKRNYIEGLFLSSGVLGTPDATSERMVSCLRILREELRFNGYVHSKVIPGTSPELVDELGRLSDRLSVNLELPSERSLGTLCPNKTKSQVMSPMEQIFKTRAQEEEHLLAHGGRRLGGPTRRALGAGPAATGIQTSATASPAGPSDTLARTEAALSMGAGTSPLLTNGACLTTMPRSRVASRRRRFAPAGQSTQIIVGASPEDDNHILKLSSALYRRFGLKRVFFSAYVPMMEDAHLPDLQTPGAAAPGAPPLPGGLAHALLRLCGRRARHARDALAGPGRGPKDRVGAGPHRAVSRGGHGRQPGAAAARAGAGAGGSPAHRCGTLARAPGLQRPQGHARHPRPRPALHHLLREEGRQEPA